MMGRGGSEMNLNLFKLTWSKSISTIVFLFVYNFLLSRRLVYLICDCILNPNAFQSFDFYDFLIHKSAVCHCDSISLSIVVMQYIIWIIIPAIVFYLVYSGIQYLFHKNTKTKP